MNDISVLTYSLHEAKFCESCDESQDPRFLRFVPMEENQIDLKNLQSSLRPIKSTHQKCKCGSTLERRRTANYIIVFDIDNPVPDVNRATNQDHIGLPSHSINELTQKINLDGKDFHLFAVLCYAVARKHFYSKIKRPNGNWELYDDLKRSATKINTNGKDDIQAVFYLSGNSLLLD